MPFGSAEIGTFRVFTGELQNSFLVELGFIWMMPSAVRCRSNRREILLLRLKLGNFDSPKLYRLVQVFTGIKFNLHEV